MARVKACMKLWPVISTGSTWGMAGRDGNGGERLVTLATGRQSGQCALDLRAPIVSRNLRCFVFLCRLVVGETLVASHHCRLLFLGWSHWKVDCWVILSYMYEYGVRRSEVGVIHPFGNANMAMTKSAQVLRDILLVRL